MTSVWKRLQRVGKRACKFQFVASFQELTVECTKKWYVAHFSLRLHTEQDKGERFGEVLGLFGVLPKLAQRSEVFNTVFPVGARARARVCLV